MKKTLVFVAMVCAMLCACKSNLDEDGVPHVKDVKHLVDAKGNPISARDFRNTYCEGLQANKNCGKVIMKLRIDRLSGKPVRW